MELCITCLWDLLEESYSEIRDVYCMVESATRALLAVSHAHLIFFSFSQFVIFLLILIRTSRARTITTPWRFLSFFFCFLQKTIQRVLDLIPCSLWLKPKNMYQHCCPKHGPPGYALVSCLLIDRKMKQSVSFIFEGSKRFCLRSW